MDHSCYFCPVFVMLSCASIYCCLVVTAGKGLTSWLSFVMSNCGFVTFPFVIGILGEVWYLIVLIPVLCPFSYFKYHTSDEAKKQRR